MFTEQQNKAININTKKLLVSAGAGSGKTASLVERIIRLITDGIDIDRLLILTFTELSSTEMKRRFVDKLNDLINMNTVHKERFKRQLFLLKKAKITTLHSFCLSVLRSYFNFVDLDPGFKMVDDIELSIIKSDMLEKTLEVAFMSKSEDFFNLLDFFNVKLTDTNLEKIILKFYNFIIINPDPEKYLNDFLKDYIHNTTTDNNIWSTIILNHIRVLFESARIRVIEAIEYCDQVDGPYKYREALIKDMEFIEKVLNCEDIAFVDLAKLILNYSFSKLPAFKKDEQISIELKEKVLNIRNNHIKPVVNNIKQKYMFKSISDMQEDVRLSYKLIDTLAKLTLDFKKNFDEEKRAKNIIDFNDLEYFCLKILSVPEVSSKLQKYYHEIFIDEYQDINYMQEMILNIIGKDGKVFMVGDIKQSIYKFRGADSSLFYYKYKTYSEDQKSDNIKISLHKNFRSRSCIIDSINFLFSQLMSEDIDGVSYTRDDAFLEAGRIFKDSKDHKISTETELHLINVDNDMEDKIDTEINLIAKRIRELTDKDSPMFILDGNGYRACEYSDIVILTRSLSSVADDLVAKLFEYGIPCISESNVNFFKTIEINTMISILQLIDNPLQDFHLISVLHCPIYNLSADELVQIKCMDRAGSLYKCLNVYIENEQNELSDKIKKFLEQLDVFRHAALNCSIVELLNLIYNKTKYEAYVGLMKNAEIARANLKYLLEKGKEYEQTNYSGVFNFIKYIEKVKNKDVRIGEANAIRDQNSVRLMTIHKSKGLEFPIVFVSLLSKKFNETDNNDKIIFNNTLGFGIDLFDADSRIKTPTLSKIALSIRNSQENRAEELRILYVAMTRAKEKLILTGMLKQNAIEELIYLTRHKDIALPTHVRLMAQDQLSLICSALIRNKSADIFNEDKHISNKEIYNKESKIKIYVQDRVELDTYIEYHDQAFESEFINQDVVDKLEWEYKDNGKDLPYNLNITEIKRLRHGEADIDNLYDNDNKYLKVPEFMREKSYSSVEKGIAIHTIMEHIDFKIEYDEKGLNALIDLLVVKGILMPMHTAFIDVDKILMFLHSPLARQIKKSKYLVKEQGFVLGLEPSFIYKDYVGDNDNTILVHGIVDCIFEVDKGLIIVDYKSDYVDRKKHVDVVMADFKDKYRLQLGIYKKAVESATGVRVLKAVIYSFELSREICVI